MMDHLFDCAICRRSINDYPFRTGRDRHIAPICKFCEGHHADRPPQAGAFMDRRKAAQLSALANVLGGEAHRQKWERAYGEA